MIEVWKDINGYEGLYQVSNLGKVKSAFTNSVLNGSKTKKGYLAIALYKNKIRKTFAAHRLVAQTFIENPNNKSEVNHKDGNKLNNAAYNLEWCTGSENVRHAFKIGLRVKQFGTSNNNVKLTEEKVFEIKKRYHNENTTMRIIANEYGVDYALIQRIISGKAWPHVILKTA
jgi:hypothetical protein